MASQLMNDIFDVSAELKAQIIAKLEAGEEVLIDDVDAIVRDVCATVAAERKTDRKPNGNRQPGTVFSSCTARIEMNSEEFYDSVKELIAGTGQTLVDQMYKHKIEKEDTDWIIHKKMSEIFDRDLTKPNPFEI